MVGEKRKPDGERDERIAMEIIVDTDGLEEQAMALPLMRISSPKLRTEREMF